jgi:hypothetical protein
LNYGAGVEKASTPGAATAPAGRPPAGAAPSFDNVVTSGHQATMMRRIWGIDDLQVRSTAAGSLIRFSYRVVDADKAKILNDKKVNPYLIDEVNRLALQVPRKAGSLTCPGTS